VSHSVETRNSKFENRKLKIETGNSKREISSFEFRVSSFEKSRGYAFLVLMIMVTLLLISLTAALPSIYTAAQREKEEELIFRGNQYARAILSFRRQFGRLPASVDELGKKTNGYRFLRHPFKDPMTKTGKWRLIHATAGGVVVDSKTMPLANPLHKPGNQTSTTNPNPPTPGANPPEDESGNQTGNQSAFSNQMGGAFIVGVASSSHKNSIRVWNNKTRYDEWEFLGIQQAVVGTITPGQQTQPAGPGQNRGMGFGGGQQPPNMPPLTPPQNPQQ
jgi:type II secretory pathway pseudopilin PulG